MALKLNGSTGYLVHNDKIATSFPFSIVTWVSVDTNATTLVVSQGQATADYYTGLQLSSNGTTKQAFARHTGESGAATKTTAPQPTTTLQLAIVVFTSATSRTLFFGDNTSVTDTYNISRTVANDDRCLVGASMYNNAAATLFLNGCVAETHWYSRSLTSTDFDDLQNGTLKPEEVADHIDGWSFKSWNSAGTYTSIGGSRTMTAVGGVYTSGRTHPVARATPAPLYFNNLEAETVDAVLPNWGTQAGSALNVKTASSVSLTAVSGTKIYWRNSDGDSALYTGAGLMADMAIRTDCKIPSLATASFFIFGHNLRGQGVGNSNGYRVLADTNNTAFRLRIVNYDSGTTSIATGSYVFSPGPTDEIHIESKIIGTSIEVRVWLNTDTKPTTASLAITNTRWTTGYPGVRFTGASFGNAGTDNIVITDGAGGEGYFDPPPLTQINAEAVAVASATADLITFINLAAVATSVATSTATLDDNGMSATPASVSSITASLSTGINLNAVSSSIATSTSALTTTPARRFSTPPLKNNAGTLLANQSNITVNVYNSSTGALIVRKTGLTSDSYGIIEIVDPSMTLDAVVSYEPVSDSFGRRLPTAIVT